jgi:hypothetical protein
MVILVIILFTVASLWKKNDAAHLASVVHLGLEPGAGYIILNSASAERMTHTYVQDVSGTLAG